MLLHNVLISGGWKPSAGLVGWGYNARDTTSMRNMPSNEALATIAAPLENETIFFDFILNKNRSTNAESEAQTVRMAMSVSISSKPKGKAGV
jgi:hypothetical protein